MKVESTHTLTLATTIIIVIASYHSVAHSIVNKWNTNYTNNRHGGGSSSGGIEDANDDGDDDNNGGGFGEYFSIVLINFLL